VNNDQRADEWKYRLSSFFLQKGKLEITNISRLKSNVYMVETPAKEKLIVKGASNTYTLFKQWQFFDKWKGTALIPFSRFPNGKKVISGLNYSWIILPFIKGRKLNYKNAADRIQAKTVLSIFHKEATNIYTHHSYKKDTLFERWHKRILTFAKNERIFHYFGYETLFNELLELSKDQFYRLFSFPWEKWDHEAKLSGQWTHGDVASHNFISTEKRTYLIDFDLMKSANQLYDYIQLGQRFLPHINWEIEHLVHASIVPEKYTIPWLTAVAIPVDMIREWNYFAAKDPPYSQVDGYLSKMQHNWERRKQFIYTVRSVEEFNQ